MKKLRYVIPITAIVVAIMFMLVPAEMFTYDKTVSKEQVIVQYYDDCGSLLVRVLDGGEEITAELKEKYPDIATDELVFTNDSNEPKNYFNDAYFKTGGILDKYTYVVRGYVTGATNGAEVVCDDDRKYNTVVPEFKADSWYFTRYVPFIEVAGGTDITDFNLVLMAWYLITICIVWIIINLMYSFVRKRIKLKSEK